MLCVQYSWTLQSDNTFLVINDQSVTPIFYRHNINQYLTDWYVMHKTLLRCVISLYIIRQPKFAISKLTPTNILFVGR